MSKLSGALQLHRQDALAAAEHHVMIKMWLFIDDLLLLQCCIKYKVLFVLSLVFFCYVFDFCDGVLTYRPYLPATGVHLVRVFLGCASPLVGLLVTLFCLWYYYLFTVQIIECLCNCAYCYNFFLSLANLHLLIKYVYMYITSKSSLSVHR